MTDAMGKIQQHGIVGLLSAILAVQGWGAVRPTAVDIQDSVKEHGAALQHIREQQAELRYSIQLLAANVRQLTEAIKDSHE